RGVPVEQTMDDLGKQLRGAIRRFPEALRERVSFLSANEVRRLDIERGISRNPGQTYGGSAIFDMGHPSIQAAIETVLGKLVLALYYKHADRVLPSHGAAA